MTIQERLKIIKLIEKMNNNKIFCDSIGIRDVSIFEPLNHSNSIDVVNDVSENPSKN